VETPKLFEDGILSRADAEVILDPYMLRLAECVFAGYDFILDIREKYPKHYVMLSPTTRAGIVHDATVAHASQRFKGLRPDVALVDALGSKVINFCDRIALRFKKLSDGLKANNIPTKQQMAFCQQTLWPDLTNVTIGYRLDATGHDIRDVQIVCWYYDEKRWNIEVPYKREDVEDVLEPRGISIVDIPGPRVRAKLPRLDKTGTSASS
jgi:hypothetical protein